MIELYQQYKSLLFRLAYQLTGSACDAEDAVQDVFIKAQHIDPERLKQQPKAYLCKMMTNHCIDLLRSAKKRRELYFGPWLPEPVSTENDSFETVIRNDLLSYAIIALLERLTPTERAVFVLREALCFDYPAIAELTGKSEANCRKMMSRARGKMGITEEDLSESESIDEQWIQSFLFALSEGKVDTVLHLLADDAVLTSDGGGKVLAAAHPIQSSKAVARFLLGIIRSAQQEGNAEFGVKVEPAVINGQTGIVFRQNNKVSGVALFSMKNNRLQNIYIIRNPDKLKQLNHD